MWLSWQTLRVLSTCAGMPLTRSVSCSVAYVNGCAIMKTTNHGTVVRVTCQWLLCSATTECTRAETGISEFLRLRAKGAGGEKILYGTNKDASVPVAVPHHLYILRYSHSRLITTMDELFTRKATFIPLVPPPPPSSSYHPSSDILYASTLQLISTVTYIYRQFTANNTSVLVGLNAEIYVRPT